MWKIPQTIFITYHHFPVGSPPLSLRRRLRTTPSPWCSATTAPLGLDRLRLGLQVLLVLRVLHCASLTSEPNESWFTYSLVRTFGSLWLTISIYQLWFLVNISVVSFINQQTHFCGGAVYRTWGELQASLNTLIYTFTNVSNVGFSKNLIPVDGPQNNMFSSPPPTCSWNWHFRPAASSQSQKIATPT